MYTINKSYTTKTEVKKSKFITYFVPISEYDGLQGKLKKITQNLIILCMLFVT